MVLNSRNSGFTKLAVALAVLGSALALATPAVANEGSAGEGRCNGHAATPKGRYIEIVLCEEGSAWGDNVWASVAFDDQWNQNSSRRLDNVYVDRADSGPNPAHWDGWLGNSTDKRAGQSGTVARDGRWFRACGHDNGSPDYLCTGWFRD